jgi:hypothetical protein
MKSNHLKFTVLIIFFALIQILINNISTIYIDWLGVVLVFLLFINVFSFSLIILIALIADLIGHWYLGTHLLAIILLSFIISPLLNFYKMSNEFQKYFILCVFYALLSLIIFIIGLITKNSFIGLNSFLIEESILVPLTLILFNLVGVRTIATDIIY